MTEALLTTQSVSRDNLLAGGNQLPVTESIVVASGNRVRGSLLGKIKKVCPTSGTRNSFNTGNGTLTSVVAGLFAQIGTYFIQCISRNAGTITVPTTGTAVGGNTGNGTMTAVTTGPDVQAGTYTAECISLTGGALTAPVVGTPGIGNTGDGTMTGVTVGANPVAGTYTAVCTSLDGGVLSMPATGTADVGNTGGGTCTGVTAGLLAKAGTYSIECKDLHGGAITVPNTGTAGGGNTGAGTCTGVSGGASRKRGVYTLECIAVAGHGGTFSVTDPDGYALPQATVAVAYINPQILFTLNDGDPDFVLGDVFTITTTDGGVFSVQEPDGSYLPDAIVGTPYTSGQINFTINEGAPDYIVGDLFTVLCGNAGTFRLTDPNGYTVDDINVGIGFTSAHINCTINDGATDFAIGDVFAVRVGNGGLFNVVAPDGANLGNASVGVAYQNAQINFTINDGATDFIIGDSFTVTAGNGGLFSVSAPDGSRLPDATVGLNYTNGHINFIINDGGNDHAIGDSFTIPITPGSGKYVLATSAAVNGSQDLDTAVILGADADATSAEVTTIGYSAGVFNSNAMTFGTGYNAANVKEELAKRGIFLKSGLAH